MPPPQINRIPLPTNNHPLRANSQQPTAKASNSFAIVNATYTYTGEGSSIPALVSIDFVTNDGTVVTSADSFAVAPDPALGMDELYTDGSVTGNTVLLIPEAADGNRRVTPGLLVKEIFVSNK